MPLTALFAAGVVILVSCADAVPVEEQQQRVRRLAPPASLHCARNELTSYTGEIDRYVRNRDSIAVVIRTDNGTVEPVTVNGPDFVSQLLLNGEAFVPGDWARIEVHAGQLRSGMRITAWVCLDGTTPPVLDWRPPAQSLQPPRHQSHLRCCADSSVSVTRRQRFK